MFAGVSSSGVVRVNVEGLALGPEWLELVRKGVRWTTRGASEDLVVAYPTSTGGRLRRASVFEGARGRAGTRPMIARSTEGDVGREAAPRPQEIFR